MFIFSVLICLMYDLIEEIIFRILEVVDALLSHVIQAAGCLSMDVKMFAGAILQEV